MKTLEIIGFKMSEVKRQNIVYHLRRIATVMLCLLTLGVGQMWSNNTSSTFYLAVDAATVGNDCGTIKYCIKYSGDNWTSWTDMTKLDKTYKGKLVYMATYTFPWDGYHNWQWIWGESMKKEWYAGSWNTDLKNGKIFVYETNTWETYSADASYTVYYVNTNDWTAANVKAYAYNSDCDKNANWAGSATSNTSKTYNGHTIHSITLNKRYATIIFNNGSSGNGNQTANITLSPTTNTGKMFDGSEWVTLAYDVTLDKQSGSGGTSTIIATPSSTKPTIASLPTRTGYTFGGYYTNTDGGGTQYYKADGTAVSGNWPAFSSGPTTLYAKWTINKYKVTFGPKGDYGESTVTATVGGSAATSGSSYNYGVKVVYTATPATGYLIEGWYSDASCSTSLNNGTATTYTVNSLTAASTVYCKFVPITITDVSVSPSSGTTGVQTMTVSFKTNVPRDGGYYYRIAEFGGVGAGTVGGGFHSNGNAITTGNANTLITTASFSTINFASTGVYTSAIQIYKDGPVTVHKTVNFTYAAGNYYTVSFNMQGHGSAVASQSIASGGTATTPSPAPTDDAYTFGGWYQEAACTNTFNFSTAITANKTLYAKWTPKTFTVTFDKQSGTGGSNSVTATYGSAMPSATMPTRSGYTFSGYYTETDGGGTKYYNADGSSARTWNIASNTTLYAYWTETKYAVEVSVSNPAAAAGYIACTAAGWSGTTSGTAQIGNQTAVTLTVGAPASGYKWGHWELSGGVVLQSGSTLDNPSINVKATAAGSATYTYDEDLTSTYYLEGVAPFGGWTTTGTQMTKKSGASTASIVYFNVTVTSSQTSPASDAYVFKIYESSSDKWYGWGPGEGGSLYWLTKDANSVGLHSNDAGNILFKPYVAGTYEFKLDYSSTYPQLTVTWPTINQLQVYSYTPPEESEHTSGGIVGNYAWDATAGTVSTKTLSLDANTKYKFKVVYNSDFYGFKTGADPTALSGDNNPSYPMTAYNCDNWRLYNDGGDSYLETTIAGDYIFSFNSNNSGNTTLSVQYPQNKILSCEANSWAQLTSNYNSVSGNVYTWNITLDADNLQEFKIVDNSRWFGSSTNTGIVLTPTDNSASLISHGGYNAKIATTMSGSYTITYNASTHAVTVTHPTIPNMTGTLTMGSSQTGKVCGTGTAESPFIVFQGSTLTLTATHASAPSTATDHIRYQYIVNGVAQTATVYSNKSFSPNTSSTTDAIPFTVKAYYEYGPDEYKSQGTPITSTTYYYKVVARPTVTLELASTEAEIDTDFGVTITTDHTDLSCMASSGPWFKLQYSKWNGSSWGSWTNYSNQYKTSITSAKIPTGTGTGFYKWRVKMWYGGTSQATSTEFTSNEVQNTIYQNYSIKIVCGENARSSGTAWFSGVYAFRNNATDFVPARENATYPGIQKDYSCTEVEDYTYIYIFKYPIYTHIVLNDFTNNNANQTTDIEITSNTCITLTGSSGSGNKQWTFTKTDNCATTYYRIRSVVGDKTYYSNAVTSTSDTVSFYAGASSDTNNKLYKEELKNGKWDSGLISPTISSGDVYTCQYGNVNSTLAVYTGSFYVRTDAETGTWNDYKDGGKTMTKFENHKDQYPNEYYNHYWCQYFNSSSTWKSINIKAQVANDYNRCLSITLPDYILPKQSNDPINWGTNIRFAYDNTTNLFEVKRLQAANLDNFLQITGYSSAADNAKNYAYKTSTINETNHMTSAHPVTMSDLSDWMYQTDFYINAPGNGTDTSSISIQANYYASGTGGSVSKLYLGGTDETKSSPFIVMGKTTTRGLYLVRVIYDYKTNRLIAAWLPYDSDLPSGVLDANMMIIRTDDNTARTVGIPSTTATLTKVHKIYGILEINKEAYRTRKNAGNMFYWISLPFDVKVKDVFGIDGFKSKWFIQRYRGDLRAQNGYKEGQTYWRNMNANETATMEAGRGYVIYLNLDLDKDFHDVSYIDENGASQKKAIKRLFFPSDNVNDFTLKYDGTTILTSEFPNNICNLSGRRNQDSNWYVAGVKGYNTAHITNPLDLSAGSPALDSTSTPMRFFYKYEWGSANKKDNYKPTAVSGFDFKPFESYMFQYAGTVTWDPKDITTTKTMPGRREILAKTENKEILLQINLDDEQGNIDRTFVSLSNEENITEEFDLNSDLAKIMNSGSQIYSIIGDDQLAGNVVPYDIESVPLGVQITEEGTYTFNLEDVTGDKTVYLYDKLLNQRTCLTYNDYDITLDAGTYNNRFFLEFAKAPSIATDIENESGAILTLNTTQFNGTLYIEGLDNNTDINLYDMTGRLITSTRYNTTIGISTPPTGIYLLSTETQTYKIIIN